jgi:hypothetical protein
MLPVGRVGEICDLINGKAFKPEDWSETGTPIIRIQNLNDGFKRFQLLGRASRSANFDFARRCVACVVGHARHLVRSPHLEWAGGNSESTYFSCLFGRNANNQTLSIRLTAE